MNDGWIIELMDEITIDRVKYRVHHSIKRPKQSSSVVPIGIDTEAYTTGECFMIATSKGDVFQYDQWPQCMFNRKYRGRVFVAYNLKYDEGALLQFLPVDKLKELRAENITEHRGFVVKIIPRKSLVIRKGKDGITIYDMLNFFNMSLDAAAEKFLGERKIDIETKRFWPWYAQHYWKRIADYCVQDAILVKQLSDVLIKKFESYGVFPKRLYSVAYVSFQYFKANTVYPIVRRYWNEHKEVLDYAMRSYTGGKFEVTEKGVDYYYEYDIVSAYPNEIAKLVDITHARVVDSPKYRRFAAYAFYDCSIKIPYECSSPIAIKRGAVNTYPCGEYRRVITKTEYEYLIGNNCDVTIHRGLHLHVDNKQYPFKREINKLMKLKHRFKAAGEDTDYHIIKIFLNSLYGKMVQLINKGDYYEAGISWNPIYGSVITANVRTRISDFQSRYPEIIAVHTDSLISTKKLPFEQEGDLGACIYETEGSGVVLGSGVYQIGEKVRFRGFNLNISLMDVIKTKKRKFSIKSIRPLTWREIAFHDWSPSRINRFEAFEKYLSVDFDCKRLWLRDWKSFREVSERKVFSAPLIVDPALSYRI